MSDTRPLVLHIRHLLGAGLGSLSDGELLDRFVTERDGNAVAELIRRHGALVLGVCRRVLADVHAAEDVFQATFLVLVRKAAALDRHRPLGAWLYTVAYRLALTARADAARRHRREMQAACLRPEATAAERSNELYVIVEEELQRLPERYRAPLVLCYLQGKTNEQAARALGLPSGSISRRIAEARERLRERLRCRGYVRPTAVSAVLAGSVRAAPGPELLDTTVRAALWFATQPETSPGVLSAAAVGLARKGLYVMALQKLKVASALLLAVGLLGGAGTLVVQAVIGAPAPQVAAAPLPGNAPLPARDALPADAVTRLGTTQLRHGDAIHFLRFTPDGRWLVTAGKDETVRLWDITSGTEIRRFERPERSRETDDAEKLGVETRPPGQAEVQCGPAFARASGFRVALSNDGKLLAASHKSAVHVWDAASGKLLRTLVHEGETPSGMIADVTFASDGKSLVTVRGDRDVCFWDLVTGKKLRHLDGTAPGRIVKAGSSVALAPGGRYLAWEDYDVPSQSSSLKVLDLTTGKPLSEAKLPVDGARALTFAPDGKTLAWTSFDNVIRIWDCTAGQEPRGLNNQPLANAGPAHTDSLVISPEGKTVAACRSDRTVQLWDVATNTMTCQLGTTPEQSAVTRRVVVKVVGGALGGNPVELAFAPDGKTVAASMGGPVIRRFHAHTGQEIDPPSGGHGGAVAELRLAADGKTATTYSPGDGVHVWDLATGREIRRIAGNAPYAALSANGLHLVTSAGGAITLFDTASGKEACKIDPGPGGVAALALSGDGNIVASRPSLGTEVYLWHAPTGRLLYTLTATPAENGGGASQVVVSKDINGVLCQDLAFSPDGRYLAAAGPKRQLCLWDTLSGNLVWEQALAADQVVEHIAFTANGRAIAAVNRDGTVGLHETATGEIRCRLGRPAGSQMQAPAVMVAGGSMMVSGLERAPTPMAVASSPDGRMLATTHKDLLIHLWDVVTGQEVGQLKGHGGAVRSLAFSANGKQLISGSMDTTALVWDVSSRRQAISSSEAPLEGKDLDACWANLAAQDSAPAFAAQQQLSRHPSQAAALVKKLLPPAKGTDPGRLAQLVADLDSPDFVIRQKATTALQELGEAAHPVLEKARSGAVSLEVRQRVDRLLQKSSGKPGGRELRELRALEMLEMAGGPEPRQTLEALAGGAPEARLTREARAALKRIH
jgi:RNA polymerase sigma factor (sigma-70 family)